MHDMILEAESLEIACVRLIGLANERGGEDNITLVVARFDGEGLPVVEEGDSIIRVEHETGG
jgi:serine/threonine protein phosphatase PrpC